MKSLSTLLLLILPFYLLAQIGEMSLSVSSKTVVVKGLKDYADFPIGGTISIEKVKLDEKLHRITTENFNSITSIEDMEMYSIIAKKNNYNWVKADSTFAFCERNNQRLFGHTLISHSELPEWIKAETEKKGEAWAQRFFQEYLYRVASHYRGKIAAWNVVNEAFENNGEAYRESFWYKIFGKDYIKKAFHVAHRADPKADLFYNDFNMVQDTAKLHAILQMIEELKAKDSPITGLGFQMHLHMDTPNEMIVYALQKAVETGLKIHISGLDIRFNSHGDEQNGEKQDVSEMTAELLLAQAEKYKQLVLIYRKYVPKAQQYGITFSDFTDRDTWIRPFFNMTDWPTVFDEQLEPKAAYYGFRDGLLEEISQE